MDEHGRVKLPCSLNRVGQPTLESGVEKSTGGQLFLRSAQGSRLRTAPPKRRPSCAGCSCFSALRYLLSCTPSRAGTPNRTNHRKQTRNGKQISSRRRLTTPITSPESSPLLIRSAIPTRHRLLRRKNFTC